MKTEASFSAEKVPLAIEVRSEAPVVERHDGSLGISIMEYVVSRDAVVGQLVPFGPFGNSRELPS
jgi:hypothetical protein